MNQFMKIDLANLNMMFVTMNLPKIFSNHDEHFLKTCECSEFNNL